MSEEYIRGYVRLLTEADKLRETNAALGELLEAIDSTLEITFTRNLPIEEAVATWDDALARAKKAYQEAIP